MDPLLANSLNIPEVIRADVVEVTERTFGKLTPTRRDIEYLFDVYNRYIARPGGEQDINCHGCRAFVVSRMRHIVRVWNENNILNGSTDIG